MKVLQTIVSFYPLVRGSINQVYLISGGLKEKGFNPTILTTYHQVKSVPKREFIDNIEVIRYKHQFRLMSYCITLGIYKTFKDFDLIHAHENRTFQTDFSAIMSHWKKKPLIINSHGTLYAYRYILKGWLPRLPYLIQDVVTMKSTIRQAKQIIVSTKREYEEAINYGISKDKLEIIPYGIDTKLYEGKAVHNLQELKSDSDQIILLFVGRINRARPLEPIIEAVNSLDKVILAIVGDEGQGAGTQRKGYLEELKLLIKKTSLEKRVKFIGPKYGQELPDCYLSADIFIYSSLHESFGLPILEAAAAGLPIISTSVGIASELVQDSETGFFINDNPNQIREKISLLLKRDVREEFGRKLKTMAGKHYDKDIVVEQYIELYKRF